MHPTNKKNILFLSVFTVIAALISIYSIARSIYYIIPIIIFVLISFLFKSSFIERLILITLLSIGELPIILIFGSMVQEVPTIAIFLLLFSLFAPLGYIFEFYNAIRHEWRYYSLIKNYPNLACKEHLTKVLRKNVFGYKEIRCRVGDRCVEQGNIEKIKVLVGTVGGVEQEKTDDNYYVNLWNSETKEIKNGDYDIIQIHENDEFKDLDAVVVKVVDYFYNEIKRYKPISKVIFRIIGNPQISESTQRLLKERFMKVEYITKNS